MHHGQDDGHNMLDENERAIKFHNQSMDLRNMRQDYGDNENPFSQAPHSWYDLFADWLTHVRKTPQPEPNAMILASVNPYGIPRTRTVLAKKISPEGIVFYSNYRSAKAQDYATNPHASATFLWLASHQQIHFSGIIKQIPPHKSDEYWNDRPRRSQIGAIVSQQSRILDRPQTLDQKYGEYQEKYAETKNLERPSYWGGYILIPRRVEFWLGRTGRLHHRLEYLQDRTVPHRWHKKYLQP